MCERKRKLVCQCSNKKIPQSSVQLLDAPCSTNAVPAEAVGRLSSDKSSHLSSSAPSLLGMAEPGKYVSSPPSPFAGMSSSAGISRSDHDSSMRGGSQIRWMDSVDKNVGWNRHCLHGLTIIGQLVCSPFFVDHIHQVRT